MILTPGPFQSKSEQKSVQFRGEVSHEQNLQ